jgi:hypothetical protein
MALFSVHALPDASGITIIQVNNPNKQSRGLRGDWVRVGSDLQAAAAREKLLHE